VPHEILPSPGTTASGDRVKPEEVGTGLLTVAQLVRRALDEHMIASGLSLAWTEVLQALNRLGSLRQAELAAELGLAVRSVSRTVEALERDGLVARRADPADLRLRLIVLTLRGSAALAASEAAWERGIREMFADFDQRRLTQLRELLGAVETGAAKAVLSGKIRVVRNL